MTRTVGRVVAVVAIVGLVAAGCGDDGGGDDDVAAYCDLSAELDAADGLPSDDDLDRVAELAPSEISDDVQTVVDAFKEEGGAAFEDEGLLAPIEAIEDYEAENCDGGTDAEETPGAEE